MARLWDVKSGELLGSFKGHLCSLKSVAFAPEEKGIPFTELTLCWLCIDDILLYHVINMFSFVTQLYFPLEPEMEIL